MTQHTGAMLPSLQSKLQQFARELTLEDEAQLRSMRMQMQRMTGELSPSLQQKAQQVAAALTQQELEGLRLLLERTDAGTMTSGEGDAQGHMIAEYDDGAGNKGPNRLAEGTDGNAGGGITRGLVWLLVFAGTVAGPVALINHPELRHPP
jgi:hypothetical protein